MWILIWLAIGNANNVDYFHVGSFDNKDKCISAMSEATVLVTNNKNQTIDCLWVPGLKNAPNMKGVLD